MTQQLLLIAIFLAGLASLPWLLRKLRGRMVSGASSVNGQTRFISALAVGPTQRVVTVEVGPQNDRVWLTLGVSAQTVSLLHTASVIGELPQKEASATEQQSRE